MADAAANANIQVLDTEGTTHYLPTKEIDGKNYPLHALKVKDDILGGYLSVFAKDTDNFDNINANKDYNNNQAFFRIAPPAGEIWLITRLIAYIEDGGSFDSGGYGNNSSPLPFGIGIAVTRGGLVIGNITELGSPIKMNTHWKKYCFDINHDNFGAGNESLGARWTFSKGGVNLRLDGDLDEEIIISLQDDLSYLVEQTFLFQGNRVVK